MEKIGQLTKEQFMDWQLKLTKLELREAKLKAVQFQHGMILKDLELNKLKAELFKQNAVASAEQALSQVKQDYETFVNEHGLKNVIVDETSYEIFVDKTE